MNLRSFAIVPFIFALVVESRPFAKDFNLNRLGLGIRSVPKRETLTNLPSRKGFQEGKRYRDLSSNVGTPAVGAAKNFTFNERDFVYPALLILLAPSVAPLSEKLFDEIIIAGQTLVGVSLQLLKEVGVVFKFSYDLVVQKLAPFASFVMSVISQSRELIQDVVHDKIPNLLKGIYLTLALFWEGTSQLISIAINFLYNNFSRTKEIVKLSMHQAMSWSSNAVTTITKEVEILFILLASVVAEGVESSSKFLVCSLSYAVNGVLSTWDMSSSFVAYSSEYLWQTIVDSVYTTFYFLQDSGGFVAKSVATLFVNTYKTLNSLTRKMCSCLAYTVGRIPEWINGFCRAMPFLEESDNGFALTDKAQTLIYIASAVGALYPDLQNGASPTASKRISNLFMVGSLARGIHLSTSLVSAVQPSLGFGALVNIGAIISKKLSVTYFMAGWFLSSNLWKFFGTRTPQLPLSSKRSEGTQRKNWFTRGA